MSRFAVWVLVACVVAGCSVNPVTGRREIHMVSEEQEIQLGQRYYRPSRQSQGGDYVTDPEVVQYVKQVGAKLAAVADRKLPYEFAVLNSGELNAWALPGGKIAVNRGLLVELTSEAELAAVLGHEIVHAAARHSAQRMEQGQLMQIGSIFASVAASAYGGADLGQMVGQGAQLGSQMLQAKYGRDDELEADRYGMKYMRLAGYDLQAAVSLQEMFVRKFRGGERNWMQGLFASHPPSQERVDANRRTMTELGGPGGDAGVERYARAVAELKRAAPAYEKQRKAVAAANERSFASARSLADEAIKLEPRESRFYGTRGEIELAGDNPRGAIVYLEKATSRDPGYFKPYVMAGIANYEAGNRTAAQPLLEKSMTLLPTAPAVYYLGRVNEDRGDRAEAARLYKMIAGSSSALGRDASERLGRVGSISAATSYDASAQADSRSKTDTTLVIHPQLDSQGRVWLAVGNRAAVAVTGVSLVVGVVDRSGRTIDGPVRVGTGVAVITPGRSVRVRTPLGPYRSPDALRYVRWRVERVEAAK